MRYALRTLLASPGFSLIAIVTLALGIGVNSSMYSLMNTLLFASAPFPRPETIVTLNGQTPTAEYMNFSPLELDELRAHPNPAFTVLAPRDGTMETVTLPDQLPEQMQGSAVHADLFKVLETPPLLGRVFTPEECVAGNDTVVLITEDFWRKKYGSKPDALGQTMRINGRIFTIIGVLPRVYSAPFLFGETKYFRPLIYSKGQQEGRNRREIGVIARLAPQATFAQALATFGPLTERWAKDYPTFYPEKYNMRMQLAGRVGGRINVMIITLQLGLAAAILAIACANLANLQMARAASRIRDLAIRSALGASRWNLIKQQLIEALVVSVTGGMLGLLVAVWSNNLIGRNIKIGLESTLELPIDSHVLAFTAGISILAGLGFGLIPAWLASRTDVNEALKQQSRGSTGGKHQGWIRRVLVIGQVALSLTLLSVAGLMIRGLNQTINGRPNWDSESILTANIQIDESAYTGEQRRTFYDALLTRLERIPGVEACTLANRLPINGGGEEEVFTDGQDPTSKTLPKSMSFLITPGFFKTLGIHLLEGRNFPENFSASAPEQVIVNQSLAKSFWPNESAVGKRLATRGQDGKIAQREVIAVVADAEQGIKFSEPTTQFQCYRLLKNEPWTWFQIALRGPNPVRFGNDLRRAVADVSPDVAARFVWTLEDMREQNLHNLTVINGVLLAFALLGLVLASVGLYGIVANNVGQRMTEFGIRLALGATGFDVMRIVLRQSVILTLIGLVLGLIGSFALGQVLRQNLGPLIAQSHLILAGTGVVIFVVALIATWFPARRATEADPIAALRAE